MGYIADARHRGNLRRALVPEVTCGGPRWCSSPRRLPPGSRWARRWHVGAAADPSCFAPVRVDGLDDGGSLDLAGKGQRRSWARRPILLRAGPRGRPRRRRRPRPCRQRAAAAMGTQAHPASRRPALTASTTEAASTLPATGSGGHGHAGASCFAPAGVDGLDDGGSLDLAGKGRQRPRARGRIPFCVGGCRRR